MKKTNPIIIALLTVAVIMTGCSKTEDTSSEALKQGEATLAHIMDFKKQLEEAKANPGTKTNSYMSIDDAVWNVEALFNLTYAYPEYSYGHTIGCDTTLYLPICSNDSVSINDLAVFYDRMFNAVQAIYQNVDLADKQFLILDVEAGDRHSGLLAIELNALQGSVVTASNSSPYPRENPFEEGVSWFYGENGGNSNGQFINMLDAADTLSRMLNANLVQVAPEGWQYSYTNIKMKELRDGQFCLYINNPNPNLGPYCEFYKENPTWDDHWLSSEQMNYHYNGECYLVQNVFRNDANDPIPSFYVLFQVSIEDRKSLSGDTISHHTQARYGFRLASRPGDVNVRGTLD